MVSIKKRIVLLALCVCMVVGLVPAAAVQALAAPDEVYDDNFSMVLSDSGHGQNRYLTTENSNAFNVVMYNSTFSTTSRLLTPRILPNI